MVDLLNQYKNGYSSESSLESLAGFFSIIELYKDDLLNNKKYASIACEGSVFSLAEATRWWSNIRCYLEI